MEQENVEKEREKEKDSFIGNTSAENENSMYLYFILYLTTSNIKIVSGFILSQMQ